MKEAVLALIAGILVGVIFKSIKLPLPAPNVLPGVLGIVGIYIGGLLFNMICKMIIK